MRSEGAGAGDSSGSMLAERRMRRFFQLVWVCPSGSEKRSGNNEIGRQDKPGSVESKKSHGCSRRKEEQSVD